VEVLSLRNPVLMVFEDTHWSDPTSLEAFSQVVDRIANLSVLLLVTFRPEFAPPWIGQPHVTALTLNRLPKRDIDAMIDGVIGNKLLPASIRQDIIERTDGIPLFVEEMTKAVLEAESEGEARQTAATIPVPALAVPASLQASLMARLDRLGPAKEVAQIGAAIGREFSHSLLATVGRKPAAELASALDRLMESGLLFRQGLPPHATYLFKHALIQDAAYGTLLREPRRALHARIAKALETRFAEIVENQPELLARHCTEAGLIEKAASLWGKAGQRSLSHSALVEAAEQLVRGLAQIASLPSNAGLRSEQIRLQVALAKALMHTKGYATTETKAAIEQARSFIEESKSLGEPLDDPLQLFSVLNSFWLADYVAFNGDVVCKVAAEFLALAKKQKARLPLTVGHRLMGTSLIATGDLVGGRAHYDQAMLLWDTAEQAELTTRFGQAIRVSILTDRSVGMWMLGYPDAALADSETALGEARKGGHAAATLHTFALTGLTKILRRDYALAGSQLNELVGLGDAKGSLFWSAYARSLRASMLVLTAENLNAVGRIKSELASLRSTGATNLVPFFLGCLASTHAAVGNFRDAWCCIDEATAMIKESREAWFEAEVHRIAGEIALKSPKRDTVKAQAYFERALAVARQQQAKSWELRAAMSMARLWRDLGKRDEARELLAPVYGWFTEGFDTPDLKEAKALLDELAA
jgi:predicted ATPase